MTTKVKTTPWSLAEGRCQSTIANGGKFSPSGPMINPVDSLTQVGERISYWYAGAEDSTYSFIELNLNKAHRGNYFGPNTKIDHINFSD